MALDAAEIRRRFTYVPPDNHRRQAHDQVRAVLIETALELMNTCPASREFSLAITHLEEVAYWANASIARPPTVQSEMYS